MGIFSFLGKSNTVYFPGCASYFKNREIFELYKKIFSKLGIDFKIIDKKICCGLPALEAGYESQARKLARRNLEIFREEGITSIITNSPGCYKMFIDNYPSLLPDWNLEVRNLWKIISEKLRDKPRLIKHKAMEMISFHDNCYLGAYCGIYDEPREILELIGYQVVEMSDNRENAVCCGSCGGLPRTNLNLAEKIAKERLLQVKRAKVKKLVVSSVEDYALLKKQDVGIEVLEISEVLAVALGIKKKEVEKSDEEVREEIEGEKRILAETRANMRLQEEIKEEDYYDSLRRQE
ncbi:hypothetical protein GF386_02485 [Candidatus Pacearchaeota archaeon]|nr:hypothetical protein [Candidatus Pacearchaeota archaeon]MBD3283011.1 hypothetical protein [Candidatus Pacearchaeota archaeon]